MKTKSPFHGFPESKRLGTLVEQLNARLDHADWPDALSLARQILGHPCVDAHAFDLAMFVILDSGQGPAYSWLRDLVDRAWSHLDKPGQAQGRPWMLAFFRALKEQEKAVNYASVVPRSLVDARESMLAFLENSRLEEAGKVAQWCRKEERQTTDAYNRGIVWYVLGRYEQALQRWDKAIRWFEQIRFPDPHWDDAAREMVRTGALVGLSALARHRNNLVHYRNEWDTKDSPASEGLQAARMHQLSRDLHALADPLQQAVHYEPPDIFDDEDGYISNY